jgi:8-oxo-dGTP pyrophosphatase MutT (NUDIX family)
MSGGARLSHIRQAGAIAVRTTDHRAEILIVRAKQRPDNWIFPKGHVEPKESAESAAVRELEEEAGVRGTVIAAAGALEFSLKEDVVRVEYFVVQYARDVPRQEDREIRWCSYDRALDLLTFPDSKTLLREARARIEQTLGVSM